MNKIIEIKIKRSYILILSILFIVIFFGGILYYYNPSEDLSIMIYLIIIFLPIIVIVLSVESYFTKIILLDTKIIKSSLFSKRIINIKEIQEVRIYKHLNYINIKTSNKDLMIGKDYERLQEFKVFLIKQLEIESIPIVYKNKWWE